MSVSFADLTVSYLAITRFDVVRFSDRTFLSSLEGRNLTNRTIAHQFEGKVLGTTSVALTAYQFFTGSIPSEAGVSYLVRSSANATDLNDVYYQSFNTENRYINFAANLGLVGEGKAAFQATYGAMSFGQSVAAIYEKVIGRTQATAAGIDVDAAIADITSRKAYFDQVANERLGGFDHELSVKAGLAGYIMAEAMKADVGLYARAVENFYLDLSDGSASFGVELIGTYGPGTTYDSVS
jgi:hypothetical protein